MFKISINNMWLVETASKVCERRSMQVQNARCLFEENPAVAANGEQSLPIFQSASYIKPVQIQYCGKPTAAAVLDTSYLVVYATRRCDPCATLVRVMGPANL